MKRKRLLYASEPANQEINVSPLIDVVFILLIFFIVTTVFVEETGVEVERPRAASAERLEKESILIAITAEGNVVYGGREIGVNGVRGTVRRKLRDASRPVIVQVDKSVSVEMYTKVHDAALQAGAETVSMATTRDG